MLIYAADILEVLGTIERSNEKTGGGARNSDIISVMDHQNSIRFFLCSSCP